MKRKLIQLSPSTIVTSLPSSWIKKNALSKGNEIELTEVDNNIMISTKSKKSASTITINAKKFSEDLFFLHADSAYIAGYDEITMLFSGKEQEELIKYIAAEVPGMIITKQTSSEIVFKDITGDHAEDVNQIINRIFNMNISMLEDAVTAIEEKEWIVVRKLKRRVL